MTLSTHSGRVDTSGRHNDRNFDVDKAAHIDQSKMADNRYFTHNSNHEKTFRELEQDFYTEHFSAYLDEQNKRNMEIYKKDRIKTIDDYYSATRTQPEDKIIQIGDKDDHVTADQLWEVAMEYQKRFDEMFGDHCKILDMAMHVDEETPHIHVRRVWIGCDEDGMERVNQSMALKNMELPLPNPSMSEGRYNNRKMTFTAMERDLLLDICKEKNIEIDRQPTEKKRRYLSVPEYKEMAKSMDEMELTRNNLKKEIDEMREEIEENKKDISVLTSQLEQFLQMQIFQGMYQDLIERARKEKEARRCAILIEAFKKEAGKALKTKNIESMIRGKDPEKELRREKHKVELLSSFIKENDMTEKMVKYLEEDRKSGREKDHTSRGK